MQAVSLNNIPIGYKPVLSSRKDILKITPSKDMKSELILQLKEVGNERQVTTHKWGEKITCQFTFTGQDPDLDIIGEAWETKVSKCKKALPIGGVRFIV